MNNRYVTDPQHLGPRDSTRWVACQGCQVRYKSIELRCPMCKRGNPKRAFAAILYAIADQLEERNSTNGIPRR